MTGKERREKILLILKERGEPVIGRTLAEELEVSRQVIVQDMALLRAQENHIASTSQGYLLLDSGKKTRVFKVTHTDEQVEEELNLIVDFGGTVEDVFVFHKVYGTVRADLDIRSRKDVQNFLHELSTGKSGLLKNITSNYHYHTVSAPTDVLLNLIRDKLEEKGFLAKLQDYEPVDFRKQTTEEA